MVLKELGNACFKATMSWTAAVGGLAASAGLGLGPLGVGALRVGLSWV